ncbi:DUF3575 domain-containing protein [Alistipes sp. OttesenSCG-928-B03]|nr:DUF3575 domain-containing protein [Alistipes sp. OttesenSCG-928-B03]
MKRILVLACFICGPVGLMAATGGNINRQGNVLQRDTTWYESQQNEVYSYSAKSLKPVTGQSITLQVEYPSRCNNFAIKTNILYLATLSPNLGVEFGLGQKTSLELSAGFSPWVKKAAEDAQAVAQPADKKFVHWLVKPEFRYWFRERFNGHFLGINALYTDFEVAGYKVPKVFKEELQYDGYAVGGSLVYGYNWRFDLRWSMEFSLGAGMLYMYYTKDNMTAEFDYPRFDRTYFGLTTAGIKLVFMIN